MNYREAKKLMLKKRDTWSRKLLVDPAAVPLTYLVSKTKMSSEMLTFIGVSCGVVSGLLFSQGSFIVGVLFYCTHFLLDAMDGKLARLKKEEDTLRGSYDFLLDGIVDLIVVLGLAFYLDSFLAYGLLFWMGLNFLIHRFTSLSYRLMNQYGIRSKKFVTKEMKQVYGEEGIARLYYKLVKRTDKLGINVLPSAAESSLVMFVALPLVHQFTNGDIMISGIVQGVSLLLMLPVLFGTLWISLKLAEKGDRDEAV